MAREKTEYELNY